MQRTVARTGAELIGLVVNDVGSDRAASYHGYSSRYGYEAKTYRYLTARNIKRLKKKNGSREKE